MTPQNLLYTEQFDESQNFKPYEGERKYIVIASTGRSGSHFLGHTLHKTGLFGFPLEYANPRNLVEWKKRLKTKEIDDTIEKLKLIRTSPNGVFSIKIHYSQIVEFGGFTGIKKLFPNAYFIILSREDALGQAISMTIARQTQQWISYQEGNNSKAKYNFKDIRANLEAIIIDTAKWRLILNESDVNFKELNFEAFFEDPKLGTERILDFTNTTKNDDLLLGGETPKKQRSKINDDWRKRFYEDNRKYQERKSIPRIFSTLRQLNKIKFK